MKVINPSTVVQSGSPSQVTPFGGFGLLTAFDRGHGNELWRTDGTSAGTVLVKDINPGTASSMPLPPGPAPIVVSGGIAYFAADDGSNGSELWVTDGTAAGTFMLKDICPGSCPSSPSLMTDVNGILYFVADDGVHGAELWRSNGTAVGTQLVSDIFPGPDTSNIYSPLNVNGTLFFNANDGVSGSELWKAVGGTATLVADITPGSGGSSAQPSLNLNGTLLFSAIVNYQLALWRSDGTAAGTTQVVDTSVVRNPQWFAGTGSVAYFVGDDATGRELWKTDGTAAGTTRVKDINPGTAGSNPSWLITIGSTLYFSANDGTSGQELWKSDGSDAGTVRVSDICPGSCDSSPSRLTPLGGGIVFDAGRPAEGYELWKSDGTDAGTTLLADINSGVSNSVPAQFSSAAGTMFFAATEDHSGDELWKTDGTTAGTMIVKDIAPNTNGDSFIFPAAFTPIGNGKVVFHAIEATDGDEPWVTDGTAARTNLLQDIVPGTNGSYVQSFTPFAGMAFFNAVNSLWKTDGTAGGTVELTSYPANASNPQNMGVYNGALYFSGYDSSVGQYGLWRSDGTLAGTTEVGLPPENPASFVTSGGLLYFFGSDANGGELWRTDGTNGGTAMVADISSGPGSTVISELTDVNGTLFFAAMPFGSTPAHLWKTTGSVATTAQVSSAVSDPQLLANVNGTLLFFGQDAANGYELWRSDGTNGGTTLVKDIFPGSASSAPSGFPYDPALTAIVVNGFYYFAANDGVNGVELWKSDGTAINTVMVKDICPGSCSSSPKYLTRSGNLLFFRAVDPVHGDELWMSDGTAAGTVLIADMEPGSGGSNPTALAAAGNLIYFTASTSSSGLDPYVACVTSTTHYTLDAPAAAVSAATINIGVTPSDTGNAYVPCYTGTVHFTSSEPTDTIPADHTFSPGEGTAPFNFVLRKLGMHTITAVDTVTSAIISTANINVGASPVNSTLTAVPTTIVANGTSASTITVRLKDANGADITSGSDNLVLSSDLGSLTAPSNNGNGTYSAALKGTVAGTATVSGTLDGVAMTQSATVNLVPGPAASFSITAPATATSGVAFSITVSALDAYNNVATAYTGTVHFSANDTGPTLPADYSFQPADNGVHTFTNGVVLHVVGSRTLTATDTVNGSIIGLAPVKVVGATTTALASSANPQPPGLQVTFTATVTSPATGASITGQVTFKDGSTTLNVATLTSGVATLATSALSPGSHAITAVYGGDSNFLGSTSAVLTQVMALAAPVVSQPSYTSGANVLAWSAVPSAAQYEVLRSSNNSAYAPIATVPSSQLTYVDSAVTSGVAYLYEVRGIDSSSNPGLLSAPVISTAIALTDETITPGTTPIKAIHITELRGAIDAVRAAAGMAAAAYSRDVQPDLFIAASDIAEMRSALDAARLPLGLPAISYTDAGPDAGVAVKAVHLLELRIGAGCTAH